MKTLPLVNQDPKSTSSLKNSQNRALALAKSEPLALSQQKIQEQKLWRQIQLIYTFLQKPNSWYTGLSIKKYLKTKIFANKITNPQIVSGRWSAYAHFSYSQSFINLINKFQLPKTAKILLHPLTPSFLVDYLVAQNWQIDSLDIDKNNLNWPPDKLEEKLTNAYDLVIFYSFNGLVEEIDQAQKILKNKVIPSLIILDNSRLNSQTVALVDNFSGGVLWTAKSNYWPGFLKDLSGLQYALAKENQEQNWYFSWFGESRTRSVLENHLSDSHEVNHQIIEAVFYLLVQKWQQYNWRNYLGGFLGGFFLTTKIKNSSQAQKIISELWPQSLELAIPDVVLELQNLESKAISKPATKTSAQEWQKYFIASLPKRSTGSLEVPSFFIPRQYLSYFVYTTEPQFWIDFILTHQKVKLEELFIKLPPLHPLIKSMNLTNTNFVAQYILILKV